MPLASLGSTIAGWTSAEAVKGVFEDWEVSDIIFFHVC